MPQGNDRFVPNAVYGGLPDNVGFQATAITTSMSAERRKQPVQCKIFLRQRNKAKCSFQGNSIQNQEGQNRTHTCGMIKCSQRSGGRLWAATEGKVRPRRSARTNKCLTEEGCQRVPPRGVLSCMASSCVAICCKVRSGAAALIPATRRISRSSPCRGWARSNRPFSTIPSLTSRWTVRRNRSAVHGFPEV